AGVAFAAGALGVTVIDNEVGSDAEIFQRGQQHRCPAVVGLAGACVEGGMVGVVGVAVFAGDDDRADFDGWVNGLHLVEVRLEARGVSVGVVRARVVVGFP